MKTLLSVNEGTGVVTAPMLCAYERLRLGSSVVDAKSDRAMALATVGDGVTLKAIPLPVDRRKDGTGILLAWILRA